MRITAQRRLALLAGLLLLASIVFAMGVQTAQAKIDTGGWSVPAVTAPAGTQGRGGFDAAHFTPPQPQGLAAAERHAHGARSRSVANVPASPAASSGTSSTSVWIAAGSIAAALIVGIAVWAQVRRRRRPGGRPSAAYCAQHPEDALCTTA